MFIEAVYSAFLEKHASTNRAYNIDNIGRLAAAIESHRYASQKMGGVPRFQSRNQLLDFACKNITVDGPSSRIWCLVRQLGQFNSVAFTILESVWF